ncbi:hypothetical protein HBA55_24225 [Pseudomaricurvus alkylphenolicus]|nr:hypothetical protein [Pseudomaricurvus alkylphenolicus]NIB42736.1 hypothetical protein [Pseudomaricurvus alkylphenolicus]
MKLDVLTVAVFVFAVGVMASAMDLSEAFADEPLPPTALQQGTTAQR